MFFFVYTLQGVYYPLPKSFFYTLPSNHYPLPKSIFYTLPSEHYTLPKSFYYTLPSDHYTLPKSYYYTLPPLITHSHQKFLQNVFFGKLKFTHCFVIPMFKGHSITRDFKKLYPLPYHLTFSDTNKETIPTTSFSPNSQFN